MKQVLLILITTFFLISCVSTVDKDSIDLKEGEGILVCKISSESMKKFSLNLSGESAWAPVVTVKQGDPAKIIVVKEGEYKFYHITVGGFMNSTGSAEFILPPVFQVDAGKVNYVGDFIYEKEGDTITTDHIDNKTATMEEAFMQNSQLADYEIVNTFE